MKHRRLNWLAFLISLLVFILWISLWSLASAAPPRFSSLGWDLSKQQWAEGNIGTWPEGEFFGCEVTISNTGNSPITLTEIDLRYSFFDGSKSIGIDYARRFYYSTTTYFAAGNTTQFPYDPSTLNPVVGWQKFPTSEPYIWNMPWTGTIGGIATSENQNAPYSDHFWGINPSGLLPSGILQPGQTLDNVSSIHAFLSKIGSVSYQALGCIL